MVSLTLPGTIGTITETIKLNSRPSDDPVVQAANPLRSLVDFENPALESAFNEYFYYKGSIAGSPGALAKYFFDAPMFVELGNTQKVELGTSAQDFDFFYIRPVSKPNFAANMSNIGWVFVDTFRNLA